MYRPQFAYEAASQHGCLEQRCHYSFDGSNTPTLVSIAAGAQLSKVPLKLDQDAPFFIRAIQVSESGVAIRLEDCDGNPLLGNPANATFPDSVPLANPAQWCESDGAGVVPVESDKWGVYCPAGGTLLLYASNPTAGAVEGLVINLHGVKWYREGACS